MHEYKESEAIQELCFSIDRRRISRRTFNRWRKYAGVEKSGYYTVTQVKKILVIGDYLTHHRNVRKAQERLTKLMECPSES